MIGITTATQSPAGLIRGDPFETVGGRRIAAAITISTLTAVKNRDWTTTAEASPATEDPAMLARKMPIIAAVPPCAGTTALIAVPPCEAPHAVLNDKAVRVRRPENVPPDQTDQR
jgi:hypothetical protein